MGAGELLVVFVAPRVGTVRFGLLCAAASTVALVLFGAAHARLGLSSFPLFLASLTAFRLALPSIRPTVPR